MKAPAAVALSFLLGLVLLQAASADTYGKGIKPGTYDSEIKRPGEKPGECVVYMTLIACKEDKNPNCTSDWDCEGSQKCCNVACKIKCDDPKPKPGSCPIPQTRCAPPFPIPKCKNDYDCDGKQKCCTPWCGKECTDPDVCDGQPPNRPGSCPPNNMMCLPNKKDVNKCEKDCQCPEGQKCCPGCGNMCVPIPSDVCNGQPPDRPGSCPPNNMMCLADKTYKNVCEKDCQCPEGHKCCPRCGNKCVPILPVEKSGQCPAFMPHGTHALFRCQEINKEQCKNDQDCGGKQKCCTEFCTNRCKDPIELISVCPAFDPSICITARPGKPDCSNDGNCTDGKKCCCLNCGLKCMTPDIVKAGRCPNIKAKCNPDLMKDKCSKDTDCTGEMKCCKMCGMTCMKPDPEPKGVCPKVNGGKSKELSCSSAQCVQDSDCKQDEKCCAYGNEQRCEKPIEVISVCPAFNPSICITARPGKPDCSNDGNCTDGKKCCCFNCGLKCMTPDIVKAGRCPNIKAKCNPDLMKDTCFKDTDCDGEMKCCKMCGMTCMKPDPEPKGVCPNVKGGMSKELSCPSVQCVQDSNCKQDEKCCAYGDGQRCEKTPTDSTGSTVKKECPKSVVCFAPDLNPQCRSDSECFPSQKCCVVNCKQLCTPV
ncbi:uncharacterized protein PAF06_008045 isoform 2-T2 [Gastrophryne carolinensis]